MGNEQTVFIIKSSKLLHLSISKQLLANRKRNWWAPMESTYEIRFQDMKKAQL